MLRFLLVSLFFVSFTSTSHLNSCDSFPQSKDNLSHAAIVIIGFWNDGFEKNTFETARILGTFFRCYGGPGGLEVHRLMFRRVQNTSRECEMVSATGRYPSIDILVRKKVKLIMTEQIFKQCFSDRVISQVFPVLSESDVADFLYCSDHNVCWIQKGKLIEFEIRKVHVDRTTEVYGGLERQVDAFSNTTHPKRHNNSYTYFNDFSFVPDYNLPLTIMMCFEFSLITLFLMSVIAMCYCTCMEAVVEDNWAEMNDLQALGIALEMRRHNVLPLENEAASSRSREQTESTMSQVDEDLRTAEIVTERT